MQKPNLIKTITPLNCPHCSQDIHVCFSFMPPSVSWIITDEEMKQNKATLKELLKSVVFKSPEEEERTLAWVDSEECVLGAEDIEEMAKAIAREQKE